MADERLTTDERQTLRVVQAMLRAYAVTPGVTPAEAGRANRYADALRTLGLGERPPDLPAEVLEASTPTGHYNMAQRLETIERLVRMITDHLDLTYVHDSGGPI